MRALAFIILITVFCGCHRRASRDRLDGVLKSSSPERTAIASESLGVTNIVTRILTAKEVQAVIEALNPTNRLDATNFKRRSVNHWLRVMNGTNTILVVDVYEDGVLSVGNYYFRLKAPIQELQM